MKTKRSQLGLIIGMAVAFCSVCMIALADESKGPDVGTRALPGAPPQQSQMPNFPQKFDVQGQEIDSFGFAVTQPGALVVDIQAQGPAVVVTLQPSGGQPITQQASGSQRLTHMVTPQDVQRSLFWLVQIRLSQPVPPKSGGHATGMVNVQSPPVDQSIVQKTAQAANAQRRQPSDQVRAQAAAQTKAKMDTAFAAAHAQFDQREAQRRASLMAAFQAQRGGAVRPRGLDEPSLSSDEETVGTRAILGTSVGAISPLQGTVKQAPLSSQALALPPPSTPVIDHLDKTQGQPKDRVTIYGRNFGNSIGDVVFHIAPTVSLTGAVESWSDTAIVVDVPDAPGLGQFEGGVFIPMGQIQSNTVSFRFIPSPQLPQITPPLSVSQGQPGDPLMLSGSAFGNSGGEVHFVVGPNGQELVVASGASSGTYWTNNQIVVNVPDASGLMGYNGFVYVVRYPDKAQSSLMPFRFNPTLEMREIRATMDRLLKGPVDAGSPAGEIQHKTNNFMFGFKDNDVFFTNARLKNGWVSDEAFVYCDTEVILGDSFCNGGAYVWDVKQGTNWPYLNVRWWLNPAPFAGYSHVYYQYSVHIVGPKGVSDGIVVP